MKRFILGLITGLLLGGGLVYAAVSTVWVNDSGVAMGTSATPVYVTIQ